MRTIIMAVALLAAALPAAAQHAGGHGHGGGLPDGWQGRVDSEAQQLADVQFMAMGAGYHIITGPHVILWRADQVAQGEYRAVASFRLTSAPERREGFGLLVGGRDLDQPTQDYLYFLARNDGSYMIRHRAGDEVHTLFDWTPHDAVVRATADTGATNTLAIEAHAGEVRFLINGTVVQTLQRVPMLNTDGIVGLRVGHHLNVHVPELSIQPLDG